MIGALSVTVPVPASRVRLLSALALAETFQVTFVARSVTQLELLVRNSMRVTRSVAAKVTAPPEAVGTKVNVEPSGRVKIGLKLSWAFRSKTVPATKVAVLEGNTLPAPN